MTSILTLLVFVFFVANIIPLSITAFLGKKNLVTLFGVIQIIFGVLLAMLSTRGI